MPGLTPSQTVGPFFSLGLTVPGTEIVATDGTSGRRITIDGIVLDGARQPVPDAVIEIWQADSSGQYAGAVTGVPTTGAAQTRFRGFGRCGTDTAGRFRFTTVMPGRVPGANGPQAPHLFVGVLARGILTRLLTRIYFDDQPSNESDAILQMVPRDRRGTLVARLVREDGYEFHIVLQGDGETVFLDV